VRVDVESRVREAYGHLAPPPEVREEVLRSIGDGGRAAPVRPRGRTAGLAAAALAAGLLLLLRAGADGPSPGAADVDAARKRNREAWERLAPALRKDHRGKWVVIANGELAAVGDTLEDVRAAAPEARHRFVFEVGTEGDAEVFASRWYAPRFSGGQLAGAIGARWTGGAGGLHVTKDGREAKVIQAPPFPRVVLRVAAPGGKAEELEVFQGTVGPPLVLTADDWERLGLARFEVPGTLSVKGMRCRRGIVRAGYEGIDGEAVLLACASVEPREKHVRLARSRDAFWNWGGSLADEHVRAGRRGLWILFGCDRVLGEGATPEAALRAGEGRTDFAYHRYLVRIPRGKPLGFDEETFGEVVRVDLNGERVRARAAAPEGPFLVPEETARRLRLEMAEEGREVRLDGEATRAGYAWRKGGEALALVVVAPPRDR